MSSQPGRIPPLEVREAATCMCALGHDCSSFAPGHALHLIQRRLASATPSEWTDAVVTAVDASSGHVVVRTLSDESVALWSSTGGSGAGATDTVSVGEPVALHSRYHVLAAGRRWFNVAR